MKIEIIDGNRIREESIKEVVRAMKMQDASCPPNVKKYMKTVKRRMEMINQDINTSSPKKFLKSLEDAGIIRIVHK